MTAVCFVGGTHYSWPLDRTSEKKFRALQALGALFVIGFSQDLCPRWFIEHAHFYLLPRLPLPILRYAEMFMLGPLLVLWLIFRHGVQVLIAQSPYEGFTAAVAKRIAACVGRRVVLVIESHGDFEESLFFYRRILFQGLYRYLMRQTARFALLYADLLRAVSHPTRQQLQRWLPGKAIFQFPAWTDIEVFLRAGFHDNERSCQHILYAGVLIPIKGVHHLINGFAHIAQAFPQAQLVIVGREDNKRYAAELKEQLNRLALDEQVRFVGEVPQAELASWMYRACVVVLPSTSEGLARVVIEAMATGTLVIGSHVGGLPEVILDGTTGFLVPSGDEMTLTERLRWVLGHPKEAREMGPQARAFAERFFSTEAYTQGYRQILIGAQAVLTGESEHADTAL